MGLIQAPGQEQRLSQAVMQALNVLQMPLPELYQYISSCEMENPLLDVSTPEMMALELPREQEQEDVIWEESDPIFSAYHNAEQKRETSAEFPDYGENFYSVLHHQISEEDKLPSSLLPLCHFLVDCLNERGYLEEPVELLAESYGTSVENMTQALYALQEMSPAGVGARSLQECLILQLLQSPDFNGYTVKLIKEGLELLAANDLRSIAKLLSLPRTEASKCCDAIRRLNPIPSRGYDTGERVSYVIPEAEIQREGDHMVVHYNDAAIPRISINQEYREMLEASANPQLVQYLKQNLASANQLIREVSGRKRTVLRVLDSLIRRQSAFFDRGFEALVPLMPSEIAEELGVNRTTVSRAIQGKYILTPMGLLEIKRLFSARSSAAGEESAASVRERIKVLIAAEDSLAPLSDEKLCQALQALGVSISRRTVAKYREGMGIPPAAQRKKRTTWALPEAVYHG